MSSEELAAEFLGHARARLAEHLAQIARCGGLLTEKEVWHRSNRHTNSVGNLILHLTGNVRQWIAAGLAGEPVVRDRPAEFAERGPLPTAEILADLERVVRRAIEILGGLDAAGLGRRHSIQGYEVSGLVAVFHVVEHFSGHTGQIVYLTKMIKDVDLSLYDAQGRKLPGWGANP
jgi:uncharacterized damage-inducible protein DinB